MTQNYQRSELKTTVNTSNEDFIIAPLESSFRLRKESMESSSTISENNTSAISYQQFKEKQGDVKLKSVSKAVQDKPKEHIVFAKEFTPTRKVEKQQGIIEIKGTKKDFKMILQKEEKSMLEKEQAPKKIWFEIAQNKQTEEQSQLLIKQEERIRLEKEKAQETFMLDQRKKKEEQSALLKEQEKLLILEKERAQDKLRLEVERKQQIKEQIAKQKLELEKQKLLEDEKVRLETLAKEKLVLQKKRDEILKDTDNEAKIKMSLKKSLFNVSRQEAQGVGFGCVRTGYVNNKKMSLLTRASSAEPPLRQSTDSPAQHRKQKSVR